MMQRSTWTRLSLTLLAAIAVTAAACSSDASDTSPLLPTAATGTLTTAGTDTSGNTGNPTHPDTANTPAPPTSNGPVASVTISPATATIQVGWYLPLAATALDANGVRVAGKQATWSVADGNILVMTDTGIARGKSAGTTKVYGTIDGHIDSATVTVIPAVAPPTTPYTPIDSTPSAPAASFNLTVHVDGALPGALPGADTSKVENVGGARVTLTRVGGTHGDTLSLSAPTGSTQTDSNGMAGFTGLAGGSYTVLIEPPSGSPYDALSGGFGPVTTNNAVLTFTLHRKS